MIFSFSLYELGSLEVAVGDPSVNPKKPLRLESSPYWKSININGNALTQLALSAMHTLSKTLLPFNSTLLPKLIEKLP
jgi:hypothetical protein